MPQKWKLGSSLLALAIASAGCPAFAQTELAAEPSAANDPAAMDAITSVDQLGDLPPGHWARSALQELIERYHCLDAPLPNNAFRGDRAISRYEFTAYLHACLQKITLPLNALRDNASQPTLTSLNRLQQEFSGDLGTFDDRSYALDKRVTDLEDRQFSLTTKLLGQAIVGVQGRGRNREDIFPRDGIKETSDPGTQINLITNTQLAFVTQFSSDNLLLLGLQSGSGDSAPRITNDVRLGYEGNTNNSVIISDLSYRFILGRRLAIMVGPVGVNPITAFRGPNRVESAGTGPISAFAQRNPILAIGNGRGGVAFDWQINRRNSLQAVFAAETPDSFGNQQGFAKGGYVTGFQFVLSPFEYMDWSLDYIHSYSPFGFLRTGIGDDQLAPAGLPLVTNAVGTTLTWQLAPEFTIGGWGGYTSSFIPGRFGTVETTNWMLFVNFPDLFGRGNLGGIYVGQPPKITNSNLPTGLNVPGLFNDLVGRPGGQPGSTTHVEAFYRWRVSDRISITPGVMLLFEPRHTPSNDPITVGVLRTTFQF